MALGDEVTFLVDTGSDRTVIHPRDAEKLRLSYERSFIGSDVTTVVGIGGRAEEHIEPCFVLLQHDDRRLDRILIPMHFARPVPDNALFPSVLGRDVISYYRLVFDQKAGVVTLDASQP